jgi:hypothetical protein
MRVRRHAGVMRFGSGRAWHCRGSCALILKSYPLAAPEPPLSVLASTLRPVTITAWITTAFGLGGVLVGAGAALLGQYLQWRREKKDRDHASRENAVEEVIVRALTVSWEAHNITVMAQEFSSMNGFLNRLFGVIKPFDYQALFAKLRSEIEALNRAGAQVLMSEDQETVTLTNAVVKASMDVLDAVTGHPKVGLLGKILRIWRGVRFGEVAAIKVAQQRLGDARRALVDHTRGSLNLKAVDLFALPAGWEDDDKQGELSN